MADPFVLGRSDSVISDVTGQPMSEDDYRALERDIGMDCQTPGREMDRFVRGQPSYQDTEVWNGSYATGELNVVSRCDTLGSNPTCVDPRSCQPREDVALQLAVLPGNEYVAARELQPMEQLTVEQEDIVRLSSEQDLIGSEWLNLIDATENNPSLSTSANPATGIWPGRYGFAVSFQRISDNTRNKSWDFSANLNKLFIDIGRGVMVSFTFASDPPVGLFVRITPIYATTSDLKEPVRRCPHHSSIHHPSNLGFPTEHRFHLVRLGHKEVLYEHDLLSGRLSVRVPVERPQGGTHCHNIPMQFMCLGSDVGGMNRRPVKLIFTLETADWVVVGRQSMDVRVCSCPKRDRAQEEKRAGLVRRSSSLQGHPSATKKPKLDDYGDGMIAFPVPRQFFENADHIAESLAIVRNPSRNTEIKATRRRLLEKWNPNMVAWLKKEKH